MTVQVPAQRESTTRESRFEAARMAIVAHAASASERFRSFAIESERDRIELAKVAANIDPCSLAQSIANYQIEDQSALYEIASIVLSHGSGPGFFRNFGIRDERARVELAKIAAENIAAGTSRHIEEFEISEEEDRFKVAAIAAATDGSRFSEYIGNYAILDENARLKLALIAAESGGWEAAWDIQKFYLSSEEDRFAVALVAAKKTSWGRSFQIEKYGLTEEWRRIEVAKAAARADGGKTAKDILRYRITNQSALIEIAEICAERNGEQISEHIEAFGIPSSRARVRIARIAAAQDGQGFSEYVLRYDISNQRDLAELAEIAMRQHPAGSIARISQYGLQDTHQRVRLAKLAASLDGEATSRFFRRFDINDPVTAIEVAQRAAEQDGYGTAKNIDQYRIKDRGALINIGQRAVRQSLYSFGQIRRNFGFTDTEALTSILMPIFSELTTSLQHRGSRVSAEFERVRDWIKAAVNNKALTAGIGIDTIGWDDLEPHEKMAGVASWLREMVPIFDDTLFSYQGEAQSMELVAGALAATILSWRNAEVNRYGTRARAALALLSGYDDIPATQLSASGSRMLWGTMVHAFEALGGQPANVLPVSLQDVPLACEAINLAATLRGLGGEVPQWSGPLQTSTEINAANTVMRVLIDDRFSQVMELDRIPEGSVTRLMHHWGGDLTPLTVLAARFASQRNWQDELPVLREIARRVLDGSFHEWRYRPDDGQLSFVADVALRAWRENPFVSRVIRGGAESASPSSDLIRGNIRAVYETNLLAHVPAEVRAEVLRGTSSREEVDQFLILPARECARQLKNIEAAMRIMRAAIEHASEEELIRIVARINDSKQEFLRSVRRIDGECAKQISEDLSHIKQLSRTRFGRVGETYRVVSVITDDPRLLLMTGDLVQSASCQNFRTGTMVDCLPAYVIDGNIKLALTYVVRERVVEQARRDLLSRGQVTVVERLDTTRQALVLEARSDVSGDIVESRSIPLGYAFRREILRLGHAANETPILLTERAYTQNHLLGGAIKDQQAELIAAFAGEVGAPLFVSGTRVIFPASRNEAGVYSDFAGGRRKGAYVLG